MFCKKCGKGISEEMTYCEKCQNKRALISAILPQIAMQLSAVIIVLNALNLFAKIDIIPIFLVQFFVLSLSVLLVVVALIFGIKSVIAFKKAKSVVYNSEYIFWSLKWRNKRKG